jgi:proline racemase
VRVDIASAGLVYAIVDTEAAGIPLRSDRLGDLRRLGIELQAAIDDVDGIVFTGAPETAEAHLRSVTVSGGTVDRSPGGTATAAVMAVLDAMGLLDEAQAFVHESITGTIFHGRAARRTIIGDNPALIADIEGSAWITGEHTFLVEDDDPFARGLTL